ncbi:hypothetical protein GDO78_015062 [Eleutherodactylus coqui]|uniref:Uncharacterized protein n=1 Tax=Eleutherodactylus coqui TaxID=57060 RepID=A0A8J6B110_ELECQ|nr:hypothetical protein GDO78_015062 [Eleutherodactylus coqui]
MVQPAYLRKALQAEYGPLLRSLFREKGPASSGPSLRVNLVYSMSAVRMTPGKGSEFLTENSFFPSHPDGTYFPPKNSHGCTYICVGTNQ